MRKLLLSAAAVVVLLAACQKKAEAPAAPAPAAPAPAAAAPAAEPTAPAAAPAAVAGFGVAECDSYVQKLTECIDTKVPEVAREQMRAGLEASRSSWQLAASTPEGKAGLAAACTQATDAARASMSAYGCTF